MKVITVMLVILAMVFMSVCTSPAQTPDNPCQKWDVNNNDKFDLEDVIYGLQILSDLRNFIITQVDYSENITCGGEKGDLTVSWQGTPKFPVTMIYRPRAEWVCPQGGCAAVQFTFEQEANPLIGKDFLWCSGYTESSFFDYEVILKDADNNETPAKSAGFNCVVVKKQSEIISSSNPDDDLLFRVAKEDGHQIYYHGTTSDNTMRLTHIQIEDNDGNFQVIIFNSGLFPIQWIFTDMTAAIYTQGTHLLDSHNALHNIVYGEENNEMILTSDIYPADLLTTISEMESQTGQKFDNAREFLNNFNVANFNGLTTLARQGGENQPLFIIAASALSLSSAASSLMKTDIQITRRLNPFGKLVEAGACALGSIISEWSKDKLDDEPGPLVDVLLCRGKTSVPHVCHYMFMRKGVMSCVRLCQTSMGCYTDICMPIQISADVAMNLEHDF